MLHTKILRSTACLVAVCGATPLMAQDLEFEIPNSGGATFELYGQFDPAYQYVDDGFDSYSALVDNASSNSRFGFNIRTRSGNTDLLFNFESAFGFRASSGVDQTQEPSALDWERTNLRKFEVIASGSAGRLYVGQGSMATDGVAEFDVSGTTLMTKAAIADVAGGFQFRQSDGTLSGIAIGDTFKTLDGARRFRIRYDTPNYNGFVLRVAAGQEILNSSDDSDYFDAAVVYSNTFADAEIETGVGYALKTTSGEEDQDQVIGSFSALFANGLNVSVSTGSQLAGTEGNYVYGKLGYIANFLEVGATRFAIDYNVANDFVSNGSKGTTWGIGVVQQFAQQNIEAYLGYQEYTFEDTSGASYSDMSSVFTGVRWRF